MKYKAKAIVVNKKKVRMVRSRHNGRYWSFPGGQVEEGELPTDALRREMDEEQGVDITDLRRYRVVRHRNGGGKYVCTIFYRGKISGEPGPYGEIKEDGWFNRYELDKLKLSPTAATMKPILERGKLI